MKYYLKQCINFKVNVWRPLVAFWTGDGYG